MCDENIGRIVGDMYITDFSHKTKHGDYYKVKCLKCGREDVRRIDHINEGNRSSHKACGWGLKKKDIRFYNIWNAIYQRINNENCHCYKFYGGRGIKCEWKYFIDFYDDMYESYREHVDKFGEKDTTIERINVDGDYCKENCTWATWYEQSRNTTKNRLFEAISPNGEIYHSNNQRDFSEKHGLNYKNVNNVLKGRRKTHKGWRFKYLE